MTVEQVKCQCFVRGKGREAACFEAALARQGEVRRASDPRGCPCECHGSGNFQGTARFVLVEGPPKRVDVQFRDPDGRGCPGPELKTLQMTKNWSGKSDEWFPTSLSPLDLRGLMSLLHQHLALRGWRVELVKTDKASGVLEGGAEVQGATKASSKALKGSNLSGCTCDASPSPFGAQIKLGSNPDCRLHGRSGRSLASAEPEVLSPEPGAVDRTVGGQADPFLSGSGRVTNRQSTAARALVLTGGAPEAEGQTDDAWAQAGTGVSGKYPGWSEVVGVMYTRKIDLPWFQLALFVDAANDDHYSWSARVRCHNGRTLKASGTVVPVGSGRDLVDATLRDIFQTAETAGRALGEAFSSGYGSGGPGYGGGPLRRY